MHDFPPPAAATHVGTNTISTNGNDAHLIVISPRHLGHQVVKPYLLRAECDLIEQVYQANDVRKVVGGIGVNPSIINSVIPDPDGQLQFDTNQLSEQWTFVLLLDLHTATGTRRHTIYGFFRDEPINPNTAQGHTGNPTLNLEATMMVTGCISVNVLATFGANGVCTDPGAIGLSGTYDFTPKVIGDMQVRSAYDALYFTDPASCAESTTVNGADSVTVSPGARQISVTADTSLPTRLRSPRGVLREVGEAVHYAAMMNSAHNEMQQSSTNFLHDDSMSEMSNFLWHVNQTLSTQRTSLIGTPFPLSMPIKLRKVVDCAPSIKVQYIKATAHNGVNERPQTIICPENTYAYMVTQVLQSMAIEYNIGEIQFRYSSFTPGVSLLEQQRGALEVMHVVPMVNMTDQAMAANAQSFFNALAVDLWPMIKLSSQQGEFNVFVRHDIHGETFVNLQFYDRPHLDGWYCTNNVYGGLFSPNYGGRDTQLTNANQLLTLTRGLGCAMCPDLDADTSTLPQDYPGYDDEPGGLPPQPIPSFRGGLSAPVANSFQSITLK